MNQRIIDLSLPVYHGMRGVEIQPNTAYDQDGFNTTRLHLYSHAGTHMDAPLHFLNGARTMDQLELNKCVGPARVIDLSSKDPNGLITVADLSAYAAKIGPGSRLLLRTDWDLHVDQPDYRTSFPRISVELAAWLAERGVWLVGVEMPSVAALGDYEELRTVHQTLLRAEIVIVECLANLRELPEEVFFIATPLKIQGGDGCPVRAIAIEGIR
ncbi:MAG: cyclase family protein [Gammaproteobacteria bacterium]|nr:cyclase family protein [Gammaproteobacteria bacterium]